jgi:hypothetical protein
MPVINPLNPVQSTILEILASERGLSVADLHAKVLSRKQDISIQSLYRIVGQMLAQQMLVKQKEKLSIHSIWIAHLQQFIDAVRLGQSSSETLLPEKDGERREVFGDSLFTIDPLWSHLYKSVASLYKDPLWYMFSSHPWHVLGMPDTESRLYDGLSPHGHKLYGNDTFLDRYAFTLNPVPCRVAFTSDPPFPKEGYSLWICGDYIVDSVLPEILTKHFAFFFQTVQSVDQFHPELFADIFHMKARCKVTVRKSADEAAALRAKFLLFFPPEHPQANSHRISS